MENYIYAGYSDRTTSSQMIIYFIKFVPGTLNYTLYSN